jgi:hypothetical protein
MTQCIGRVYWGLFNELVNQSVHPSETTRRQPALYRKLCPHYVQCKSLGELSVILVLCPLPPGEIEAGRPSETRRDV